MTCFDEWLKNFEYYNALIKCIIFVRRTLLAQKLSLSSNKRKNLSNLLQWICNSNKKKYIWQKNFWRNRGELHYIQIRIIMKNEFKFEEIAKQILGNLPSDFGKIQEDVEKNLKSSLQATFSRLDLVSREEFDIQSELLSRTRSLVEVLEKKIDTLEQDRKQ